MTSEQAMKRFNELLSKVETESENVGLQGERGTRDEEQKSRDARDGVSAELRQFVQSLLPKGAAGIPGPQMYLVRRRYVGKPKIKGPSTEYLEGFVSKKKGDKEARPIWEANSQDAAEYEKAEAAAVVKSVTTNDSDYEYKAVKSQIAREEEDE
jgi:hypothetical protein